jgi:hypothetical protein
VPSSDSHDQYHDSSRHEPDNVDAEFAKIVASFDSAPEWPKGPEPKAGPVWPASGPVLNQLPSEPSLLDGLDTFGAHLPDDAPDRFVPPPPPPFPHIPFAAIMALLAIVVGFVLFFDRDILPVSSPVSMLIGLAGVLGGAAALIMRLRPGGEDDVPPPDDGAVV